MRQCFPRLKVFDATGVFCDDRIGREKTRADHLYRHTGQLSVQGSQQILLRLFNRFSTQAHPSAAG